jgi:tetratricopeptide (TPR) repeat protein
MRPPTGGRVFPMTRLNAKIRLAEEHVVAGDLPAAREVLTAVLADAPGHARALLQLSYVESLEGRYRAARSYALQAHNTRPRDEVVVQELVRRLRTFNEARAIHECLQALPPLNHVGITLLVTLAAQLSYLNRQEQALRLLDEARRGDPDYPPTLASRAQVLTYLGRFDEAEADLLHCLKLAPELASAWWSLSRLRRQAPDSNHVDAIRHQLQRPNLRAGDAALLGFALHKELDDLGEHRQAWEALESACKAKRSTLTYLTEESRALFDTLVSVPAPPPAASPIDDQRTPIFIVGMHRSGTTLLEQLLDGHSQVQGLGELYDFTAQMRLATDHHCRGVIDRRLVVRAAHVNFGEVGAGYLRGLAWRLGRERCFTDKLPSNFLNIGFICRALPNARILHMRRDPMETCFSNLRELFSDANAYSYDQRELGDFHRQYERLMSHWHAVFPGRILDVDYADLVRDPEGTMRNVTGFCGLEFEPEMLALQQRNRGVATASAVQVRGQIAAPSQPKWKAYEDWLGPLREALAG